MASQTGIGRNAIVVELRRQPGGGTVADVAGSGHHQVAGGHTRSTLAVMAILAFTSRHALVVKAVTQAAPCWLATQGVRFDAAHVRTHQRTTHNRLDLRSKASAIGVAAAAIAILTGVVAIRANLQIGHAIERQAPFVAIHTLHLGHPVDAGVHGRILHVDTRK